MVHLIIKRKKLKVKIGTVNKVVPSVAFTCRNERVGQGLVPRPIEKRSE